VRYLWCFTESGVLCAAGTVCRCHTATA